MYFLYLGVKGLRGTEPWTREGGTHRTLALGRLYPDMKPIKIPKIQFWGKYRDPLMFPVQLHPFHIPPVKMHAHVGHNYRDIIYSVPKLEGC